MIEKMNGCNFMRSNFVISINFPSQKRVYGILSDQVTCNTNVQLKADAIREKLKFLLKEFQFIKSLTIKWSIVCHAPSNFQ